MMDVVFMVRLQFTNPEQDTMSENQQTLGNVGYSSAEGGQLWTPCVRCQQFHDFTD